MIIFLLKITSEKGVDLKIFACGAFKFREFCLNSKVCAKEVHFFACGALPKRCLIAKKKLILNC